MNYKKIVYILAFGLLGLIISTVIHGVVELVLLDLIFGDPSNSSSVWWQEWEMIHLVGATVLWVCGAVVGLYLGVVWWSEYGSKSGAFGWRK